MLPAIVVAATAWFVCCEDAEEELVELELLVVDTELTTAVDVATEFGMLFTNGLRLWLSILRKKHGWIMSSGSTRAPTGGFA